MIIHSCKLTDRVSSGAVKSSGRARGAKVLALVLLRFEIVTLN